jgi:hypothetical protein
MQSPQIDDVVDKLRVESDKALRILHDRDGRGARKNFLAQGRSSDTEEKPGEPANSGVKSSWEMLQVASRMKASMGVGATLTIFTLPTCVSHALPDIADAMRRHAGMETAVGNIRGVRVTVSGGGQLNSGDPLPP